MRLVSSPREASVSFVFCAGTKRQPVRMTSRLDGETETRSSSRSTKHDSFGSEEVDEIGEAEAKVVRLMFDSLERDFITLLGGLRRFVSR